MAVKTHKLVKDQSQLGVHVLANYLQLLDQHIQFLSPGDLIRNCLEIVKWLACAQGTYEELWESLQIVEDFLVHVIETAPEDIRHEVITAILNKFYQYISDPKSTVCPATSVVLVVINTDNFAAETALSWLNQQGEGPGAAGLRASLSRLFTWLCQWNGTPYMATWVLAFIKALEEKKRFDLLKDVTVENVGLLFSALGEPSALKQSSTDVVLHLLSSLRECIEALDAISPHVDRVLTNLATDSGQFSRQLLQNVVDILTEMVNGLSGASSDTPAFRNKYSFVISCLERHMASRGCRFLQMLPWKTRRIADKPSNSTAPARKVGLMNLGNTCYMNSIMQALLVTRLFSTHVMLHKTQVPYWSKMGILFAKMIHSITNSLDPVDFFVVCKPPYFSHNNQHDSSEFLGYLFELLHSFEYCNDVNFDYKRPSGRGMTPVNPRLRISVIQSAPAQTSDAEMAEPPANRRPASPTPSSSGCISSLKRPSLCENLPLKKRTRMLEPAQHRNSFIDSMFGGVLVTRVECTVCHSVFVSHDDFRDLQLAFPEKPDGFQYTVQSLLEYYCSVEKLTDDNKYKCCECGILTEAERSVHFEIAPKYLIIVLKNFKFEQKLKVQTKLMHKTYHDYKITLPTERSQPVYDLYAAVIHAGTTLDSGHYYTLAKDGDSWYCYNDAIVTATTEAEINRLDTSCTPYVLFYRRTDVEEGAVPALTGLPSRLQAHVMSHNKEVVDNAHNRRRRGRVTRLASNMDNYRGNYGHDSDEE